MYPYDLNSAPYLPQFPMQQPSQSIQYVNDRQSAEAYQMTANSSVILMDSNLPRFYMKQTDASGKATIKSYDFKETEEAKPAEYVTKEEFEAFKAKMKGVNRNESTHDARKQQQ